MGGSLQKDGLEMTQSPMQRTIMARLGLLLALLGLQKSEAGLLKIGRPLPWPQSLPYLRRIRHAGVRQFLHVYDRLKDIEQDELLWGDEIEYGIFKVDRERRTIRVSLRGKEVMEQLISKEEAHRQRLEGCKWHPEFGSWMIESTPATPYTGYATELLRVEQNMRLRRKRLLTSLNRDEIAPTVTNFPLMGVGTFTDPPSEPGGPVFKSKYVPDVCINPHPRFGTLVANIRSRRGSKVDIQVPLFQDTNTPEFRQHVAGDPRPSIDMDAMAFGMGCCCLQITVQARDMEESRYLYDQLAVMAPIMMALSAASPIHKGRLADTDARWDTIAGSVDDRTPAERGELGSDCQVLENAANEDMAGRGVRRVYKSRYDSISTYIYGCGDSDNGGDKRFLDHLRKYNDIPCEVDEELLVMLRKAGVDDALSRHVAHLFIRDPLVIFDDSLDVDDQRSTEHFENIQSTNWQTVRWKPPPPRTNPSDPHIGWRTEFRSMEIQLTDFENAAFTVFVILLTRIILTFDLTLYVPLSKVDENMRRAHQRDGLLKHKFFFRKHLAPLRQGQASGQSHETSTAQQKTDADMAAMGFGPCAAKDENDEYEEMTIGEILNGKGDYFLGLIPLCYMYLDVIGCDKETTQRVSLYLDYIRRRGTGETMTTAAWIRKFVTGHPEYKGDSVVNEAVAYDLMMECKRIGEGKKQCPELLGPIAIDPIFAAEAYAVYLSSTKLEGSERAKLLREYQMREPFKRHRKATAPVQVEKTGKEEDDFFQ